MQNLPPCVYCGAVNYRYGFDAGSVFADALSNPIGFLFHIGKSIKNSCVDNVPYMPLLKCNSCNGLSVVCPHCSGMLRIEAKPSYGDVLTCGFCSESFECCERSDAFDAALAGRL